MGLFDFFKRKGAAKGPSGAVSRNISRLTNKYIDSDIRYDAAQQLAADGSPDAISGLLKRFRFMVDSSIKDGEEKQYVCDLLQELDDAAVEPLIAYLRDEDEVVWAVQALRRIVPPDKFRSVLLDLLRQFQDAEHIRFPAKVIVIIDAIAEFETDEVIRALLPFLDDDDDDVRLATVKALSHPEYEEYARDHLLRVLVESEDRPRVVQAIIEAVCELGWLVKGHRPAVEKLLPEGFYLVGKGTIKRRTSDSN